MTSRDLLRTATPVLLATVFAWAGAHAAEPVKLVVLAPAQGRLEDLLEHEVHNAAALGKLPYVQITAEWCGPCKALRASLADPLMRDAFAGTYIVQVDYDAWKPQLERAGFSGQAIPVFYAVDAEARPTGAKIDGGAWGEDIPRNMAPPLKQFFTSERSKAH
ncbi:MAG TPA: thioredoxin family protein [Gammaproteobacteria bacterium]|nr:thioredoxin family protein [Gammaproteobacteria bacterium]